MINETDTAMIALMAENDDLRAQLLQAPNAKMVAFVAAFELWLETDKNLCKDYAKRNRNEIGSADEWHAITNTSIKYNELKAQYLGESESEA